MKSNQYYAAIADNDVWGVGINPEAAEEHAHANMDSRRIQHIPLHITLCTERLYVYMAGTDRVRVRCTFAAHVADLDDPIHWSALTVYDDETIVQGDLWDVVYSYHHSAASEIVLNDAGALVEWPQYFIAFDDESPDDSTPSEPVDWTGLREALDRRADTLRTFDDPQYYVAIGAVGYVWGAGESEDDALRDTRRGFAIAGIDQPDIQPIIDTLKFYPATRALYDHVMAAGGDCSVRLRCNGETRIADLDNV